MQAQQLDVYANFFESSFLFNPANTASDHDEEIDLSYQKGLSKFSNAPEYIRASYQIPLIANNISLGAALTSNKFGLIRQNSINLSFAYKIKIDDEEIRQLQIGTSLNLSQLQLNSDAAIGDIEDSIFLNDSSLAPNINVGVSYKSKEHWRDYDTSIFQAGLATGKTISSIRSFEDLNYKESFFTVAELRFGMPYSEEFFYEIYCKVFLDSFDRIYSLVAGKFIFNKRFILGLGIDSGFSIIPLAGVAVDIGSGVRNLEIILNSKIITKREIQEFNPGFGLTLRYLNEKY